jgi:large subunit ribosomal protein L31e
VSEAKIEIDRIYTVPLSRAWIAPRYKRTSRAVNVLKEFAKRHMKSSEIKIDSNLNLKMWSRGITKPPRRIVVRMVKDEDGLVTITLPKLEKAEPSREPQAGELEDEEKTTSKEEQETTINPSASTTRLR